MKMKVICYARVPASHQNPENQLIGLRAAAERYGWTIIKEYVDHGISGKKGRDKRPQFDGMIKSVMKKEVDLVSFGE